MELSADQNVFIQQLRAALTAYQQSGDPRMKTPATNLEWNAKKLTGEYAAESLDGPTFALRTQADLELIAAALAPGAAGQAFAARGANEVVSLFGGGTAAAPAPTPMQTSASAPSPAPAPAPTDAASTAAPSAASPAAAPQPPAVDVKALLTGKAEHAGEKLAWKTSVVDLLKLLGKDTSQAARHRYAVALGFPESEIGNMPSAEFNTWLHGQLMASLAQNGGNLPANIA